MMKTGWITKLLAVLLCLCMTVSLLPTHFASAEDGKAPETEGEGTVVSFGDGGENLTVSDG